MECLNLNTCYQKSLLLIAKPLDNVVSSYDAQLAGLTEVGNAFVVPTEIDIHQSAVVVGFGKIGVTLDGRGVIDKGGLEILTATPHIGPVVIGIGKVGSQGDGPVVIAQNHFIFNRRRFLHQPKVGEFARLAGCNRGGRKRIRDRIFAGCGRENILYLPTTDIGPQEIGKHEIGTQRHDMVEIGQGIVEILQEHKVDSPTEIGYGIGGIDVDEP